MNKEISKIYDVTVQNRSIANIEGSKGTARTAIPFSSSDSILNIRLCHAGRSISAAWHFFNS